MEVSYKPLIEDMLWSYSRVGSFDDCKYGWFLRYIKHYKEGEQFYASYGSFIHKILERYYRGEISRDEMLPEFMSGFEETVQGQRPAQSTVDKYINGAIEYLQSFEPFPFNMIDVEKKINFELGKYNFVGYIDYLGEKDGDLYIVDNKSGDIRPRSKKNNTVKDRELDEKLRQMYIYSIAVENEYGKLPKALCFNCFRTGVFIQEPFSVEAYEEAKTWALETIARIEEEDRFLGNPDFFKCKYVCGLKEQCEYYEDFIKEFRRSKWSRKT